MPFDYDSYSYSETDCDLLRRTNKYKDNYKDIYENTTNNSHTEENVVQTKLMNIYIERNDMFTIFLQQILNNRLLLLRERERERKREMLCPQHFHNKS